jgi:hypothetical protein
MMIIKIQLIFHVKTITIKKKIYKQIESFQTFKLAIQRLKDHPVGNQYYSKRLLIKYSQHQLLFNCYKILLFF